MSDASQLAEVERGSVVAAAGCGKTELIARAVASSRGRQLVLTHTNAGVEALLRRLRRFGVGRDRVAVDTIHGWCIKYLVSYPQLSGGLPTTTEGGVQWATVCMRMAEFLACLLIKEVVLASYSGVYVDEYQDCTPDQHEFIVRLGALLPVRVLGDPMQGVFRFAGEPPAWGAVVEKEFPNVATLTKPWRWMRSGENAELGAWLTDARSTLEAGGVLRLDDARVRYVQTPSYNDWVEQAQACCFEVGQRQGTSAAILKWPSDYQTIGRITGGFFQCVEPIDAKDAARMLEDLEDSAPDGRLEVLLSFLGSISSRSDSALEQVRELIKADAPPDDVDEGVVKAVTIVRQDAQFSSVADAAGFLDGVAGWADVKVFRWELLRSVIDSLLDAHEVGYLGLLDFLRRRRNLTSHIGRRLGRRVAGSTLLLKGMEFDDVIVVDTGKFSVHDLYVALTRGSKSLTVLSPTPTIDVRRLAGF